MGLPQTKLSVAEYMEWENRQPERHELYRGEIFAMVGVRRVHGLVVGNVFAALRQQLKGTPYRVFSESLKVQVAEDTIFYPDLFVTCDGDDLRTEYIFRNPSLVVEVLSESTQSYDRGRKFALYRRLHSLREYLLVSPDSRLVELYRRGADGHFTLYDCSETARFPLASVGVELSLEDIFEGLENEESRIV